MNHIKNILHLYKVDWKRLFHNPMAAFLVVALAVLPSLYAWFNIKALWDPYGNTGELPIAIYSADAGASLKGKDIEIGDQVIETLHKNEQLGWRFVDSKKEVTDGVRSGKYYAGIYLPKEFSKDLLSFVSGDIKKPTIEYYINEKINAIAPKITDKGASSLQEQITNEFIDTASNTLLKAMNEVGYDIDSNLVSINKVKTLILETDANINEIDSYAQQVVDLNNKLPEIKSKFEKAKEFEAYLPQVDEMGQKLVTLNDKMPTIKKQASVILTLQQKIPEIQNAGKQIAMVDEDFDTIKETMTSGISDAKQGLQVIQQVQGILPNIKQLGQDADQLAGQLKTGAEKMEQNLPQITNTVATVIKYLQNINTDISSLTGNIKDVSKMTPEERANIVKAINDYSADLDFRKQTITDLQELIQGLPNYKDSRILQDLNTRLGNAGNLISDLQGRLQNLATAVQAGKNEHAVQDALSSVQSIANQLNNVLADIDTQQIQSAISSSLTTAIDGLTQAQDAINKAQQLDLDSLLTNTEKTVSNAISILEKYEKELPAIGEEIHTANTLLNGHMDEIINGINTGADLYTNELPELSTKLATAASFIQNDWPGIRKDITTTMDTVDEKMPQLESALSAASKLIQEDWPTLKTGLHKAAEAIKKGESQVDLGQIIKLLKADASKESDFITHPVELKTNQMYPIANNGSASTPFYTALCLWVGAVLLSSVATTEVTIGKKDKGTYSVREKFLARMMTFLTFGIAQSLIVQLGNIFLLGVDVREPGLSVLFTLLVGLAFMMIVYVLVGLFGNIGKGIAVIILVLSISGGGGNYPIQVSSKFFQMINPLLPFTHAVNLLRETAGGIYWPNATKNIFIMIALFVVFGIVGTIVHPLIDDKTKKIAKLTQDSHFFH